MPHKCCSRQTRKDAPHKILESLDFDVTCMTKARKRKPTNNRKSRSAGKAERNNSSGGNSTAQDSEYRDLRERVEARKDSKEILKIAAMIEENP